MRCSVVLVGPAPAAVALTAMTIDLPRHRAATLSTPKPSPKKKIVMLPVPPAVLHIVLHLGLCRLKRVAVNNRRDRNSHPVALRYAAMARLFIWVALAWES